MNDASQNILARFREDFCKLSGHSPFPWQERLFERFCRGDLPSALDLPTGLGKTSVMAIWLLARAHADEAIRREIPRRLVYVVDRRAVVDQATTEAENIRKKLEDAPALKHSLRLGGKGALPISTLRGKYVDNRDWLTDPTVPAIVVGTVDMVGSRLLFSGYGVSSKMRPYHAGFLGADTLVVLDEAHLVPPFEALLDDIERNTPVFGPFSGNDLSSVQPLKLLSLSATGRERRGNVFRLCDTDLGHAVVRQRMDAQKRLKLESSVAASELAKAMAERAWERGANGRRVIVFCNSRKVAQAVHEDLGKRLERRLKETLGRAPPDRVAIELIVGARRVRERENLVRSRVFWRFSPKTAAEEQAKADGLPGFLICTSAGEVGIDLDADHMVCDLVPWERMVQRLSRVNRQGEFSAGSLIDVFPAFSEKDKEAEIAIDEERLSAWRAPFESERWPMGEDRRRDSSPGALRLLREDALFKALADKATTPVPLRPALTRPLVDAWSMTSLERHTGRPEIQPWLRGWVEGEPPQTQIVWRRHLPVRDGVAEAPDKEINEFFEAAPPHMSEGLEAETWRVCDWLIARAQAMVKARERKAQDDELVLGKEGVAAMVLDHKDELAGDLLNYEEIASFGNKESERDKKELERILAGNTLVVSAMLGGLRDDGLLDKGAASPPRTIDDGIEWLPAGEDGVPPIRFRVRAGSIAEEGGRNWRKAYAFPTRFSADGDVEAQLIVEQWRGAAQQEDGRAIARFSQLLKDHQEKAVSMILKLATELGLPPRYAKALATAARLHDEGKALWRWQRAFNAPRDRDYAKTRGPLNVKLLDGYRHEFGSLWKVREDADFKQLDREMQDLVLHLVAAHHGFARPLISTRNCEQTSPEKVAYEVALRFARLQKRWGPWGLAWLEALLRAADQQASRENSEDEIEEPDAGRTSKAAEEAV